MRLKRDVHKLIMDTNKACTFNCCKRFVQWRKLALHRGGQEGAPEGVPATVASIASSCLTVTGF